MLPRGGLWQVAAQGMGISGFVQVVGCARCDAFDE